jgi:hypothetical protein
LLVFILSCYSTLVEFLDAESTLDKEWLTGLVSRYIMATLLLHCRRNSNGFTIAHGYYEFSRRPTQARDPQGSLLGAVLFNTLPTHTV